MAVLYTPHFVQFFDDNGDPLNGGKLYTYSAGTDTPKATYTTAAASVQNANPVVLDSAGRAVVFLSGSYKFRLETSSGTLVRETDNVTAFGTAGVDNITGNFTEAAIQAADSVIFADFTDSNATRRDTVQGILDLVPIDLESKADTVVLAADKITFYDASDSDNPKTDTVQGILDLVLPSNLTEVVVTASDIISFSDASDTNILKRDTVDGILDLIGAKIAGMAFDAVGTHMFAVKNSSSGATEPGTTVAGSTLDPCSGNANVSATVPSGTWMCLGYATNSTAATTATTLWKRTV